MEGSKDDDEDNLDKGYMTAKDFMNDFATEEFLTKNIRVRPISGFAKDDEKSDHMSRNNMGDMTDDEEKDNKMAILEMDEQRKKIKVQKEEIEKRKLLEAEKQAKAAKKKS